MCDSYNTPHTQHNDTPNNLITEETLKDYAYEFASYSLLAEQDQAYLTEMQTLFRIAWNFATEGNPKWLPKEAESKLVE